MLVHSILIPLMNAFFALHQVCRLEECLADYTRLEVLTDCICRKCSMVATYQRLEQEAERLTEALESDPDPSSSKRKRAREARRLALKMKAALAEGRIEEDIKGVTMEKVMSLESTKQSMIARVRFASFLFYFTHLHESFKITATASARLAPQPLAAFRPLRHQKQLSRALPGSARLDSLHDIGKAIHKPIEPHLRAASTTPAHALYNADTCDVRVPAHAVSSVRRRLPLRAAFLRALRVLPAHATTALRRRPSLCPSTAALSTRVRL